MLFTPRRSNFGPYQLKLGTLRWITTVAWDGQKDVTSRKTRVTFYRRPSGAVCFRRVSRREDNGETDKSSRILIVTFLLKLSSQWVKYALACVYIDLPIGEMKKKKKRKCLSSFITQLAAAWRLLVFYLVSSAMAEENCRKER